MFSKLSAALLLVLVISPFTAPFRTCEAGLVGQRSGSTAPALASVPTTGPAVDDRTLLDEVIVAEPGRSGYASLDALTPGAVAAARPAVASAAPPPSRRSASRRPTVGTVLRV